MQGKIVGSGSKARYLLDGVEVTRARFFAAFPEPVSTDGAGLIGWKPIHSDALCYHPKQRAEAEAHLKKLGVPTEIDRKGRPVLTSRSHRRKVLDALGVHDNAGGYSDG